MSDNTENKFSDEVESILRSYYGEENVERNQYLSETGRYADFLVYGPFCNWAIEVENDWESVVEGVGQSFLYAAHYSSTFPMVVIPEDHAEYPEAELLRQYVPIVEL